jgi:hypothetical protein
MNDPLRHAADLQIAVIPAEGELRSKPLVRLEPVIENRSGAGLQLAGALICQRVCGLLQHAHSTIQSQKTIQSP